MPIGTVKFFNPDKGFGFIAPEGGGNDAFVHISAVERAGMSTLDKDQRVSYELEQDQRGRATGYALFLINAAIGLAVTVVLYAAILEFTAIHYLVARAIVSLVAGLMVFVLNAVFNFRQI